MLRYLFICLLLFVFSDEIHSQNHDYYWVMGYGSHPSTTVVGGTDIDFNVSPPDTSYVFRDMNMVTSGNSVCDTYGNLLFYTNGCYTQVKVI